MKIAIIGTGRVGATTAFCLTDNKQIDELLLINRTPEKAKGLKADLAGAYPSYCNKIKVADIEDANDADIILITCGSFGAPDGSSLWEINKPIIQNMFNKLKPKKDAKIVVITTPCDEIAGLIHKLSDLDHKNIIGFGGQLDENRLKYLIYSDINNFSKDLNAHFIGEHGKRGIPVFRENVSDRKKIMNHTKNYFGEHLAQYNASTFGTAKELAKLIETLMSEKSKTLEVSYYDTNHKIFITWPCVVNKDGVKPIDLDLNDEERKEFDDLITIRKKENSF